MRSRLLSASKIERIDAEHVLVGLLGLGDVAELVLEVLARRRPITPWTALSLDGTEDVGV